MTVQTPIHLKPMSEFAVNGRLQGTIGAYDAVTGEYLTEVYCANWSDLKERQKAVRDIAEWTDRPQEIVAKAVIEFMKQVRQDEAQLRAQPNGGSLRPAPAPDNGRPRIVVINTRLRDLASEGWGTLRAFNRPQARVFRFGSRNIAKIIPNASQTGLEVQVIDQDAMLALLEDIADWVKVDRSGGDIPADPPEKVIKYMLADVPPDMPQLNGIATSPFILRNGEIVSEPGHNPQSGWYMDPGPLKLPDVPEAPSSLDVSDAVKLLFDDLLHDFVFASAGDRANALALMLTPLCRGLYSGPTPMCVIEAPAPRSGKSLLAEVIGIIATGRPPVMAGTPAKEEDWVKDLSSLLAGGASMVNLDNASARIASPYFAYVLTSTDPSVRIFGSNTRRVTLPNRITWMMTANNPSFSEEMAQRKYRCRLDTGLPNPALRSGFKHDPLRPWVISHRGELLKALFILVRNWLAEGREPGKRKLGGFEGHGQTIGGILEAAQITGFLDDHYDATAPAFAEAEEWELLCDWWAAEIGIGEANRVTARQVLDLMTKHHLFIEAYASGTREAAEMRVGRDILPSVKDRRFGRHFLRLGGQTRNKTKGWFLDPARDHETAHEEEK